MDDLSIKFSMTIYVPVYHTGTGSNMTIHFTERLYGVPVHVPRYPAYDYTGTVSVPYLFTTRSLEVFSRSLYVVRTSNNETMTTTRLSTSSSPSASDDVTTTISTTTTNHATAIDAVAVTGVCSGTGTGTGSSAITGASTTEMKGKRRGESLTKDDCCYSDSEENDNDSKNNSNNENKCTFPQATQELMKQRRIVRAVPRPNSLLSLVSGAVSGADMVAHAHSCSTDGNLPLSAGPLPAHNSGHSTLTTNTNTKTKNLFGSIDLVSEVPTTNLSVPITTTTVNNNDVKIQEETTPMSSALISTDPNRGSGSTGGFGTSNAITNTTGTSSSSSGIDAASLLSNINHGSTKPNKCLTAQQQDILAGFGITKDLIAQSGLCSFEVMRTLLMPKFQEQDQKIGKLQEELEKKKELTRVLMKTHIGQLRKWKPTKEESKVFELLPNCRENSSLHPKHNSATAISAVFKVGEIGYYKSKISNVDELPSTLLAMDRPLQYSNEADVQLIVGNVLNDAVKYVNWARGGNNILVSRMEANIFSNKPDHMVVYNSVNGDLLPVLNVEVKMPHCKVFEQTKIYGQIFDYLMTSKLQHGKSTFGIVTTFRKTKAVWVPDDHSDDVAQKEGRMTESNLANLLKPILLSQATEATAESLPTRRTVTPPKFLCHEGKNECVYSSKEKNEPEVNKECVYSSKVKNKAKVNNECVRKINASEETYAAHHLFTVLCNAIIAALLAGQETLTIFNEKFENQGSLPAGQVVLVLMSPQTGNVYHKWIKLQKGIIVNGPLKFRKQKVYECLKQKASTSRKLKVSECSKQEASASCKQKVSECSEHEVSEFYIVEYIGVGSTSRVWRSVVKVKNDDSEKKEVWVTCVIKYWVYMYNEETKEWLTNANVTKKSKEKADKEVEMYKAVYSELDEFVMSQKVGIRWCVILPFFQHLSVGERQEALHEIKNVLLTKFYKQEGQVSYGFKECDQRWRHIGKRGGSIYMFDLGDLIVKQDTDFKTHTEIVNIHIARLTRRLG
jgi:hypothetical protein